MTGAIRFCDTCGGVNRMGARFCAHCGRALPDISGPISPVLNTPLPPSHVLKQRYRILKKLGEGGFGAIYQAEDDYFNQALRAVKEMRMQQLDAQEARKAIAAFKQEAILLAGLMHPNLPRIYDYFEDNGRWYLVMDYIEGETLSERLRQSPEGRLEVAQVLPWAIQLCTVLGYLHSRPAPVIFRDLKPGNVMVTEDDHIYLIDFGIARLFKPDQAKDTLALGSPGYAAPEQYGTAQTTERSDIYSLGATLHHLLSGRDPSEEPFEFPPLDLDQSAPAGPVLAKLIAQMVDIKRENRPASVQEIKQELQRVEQEALQKALLQSVQPRRKRKPKQTLAQVQPPPQTPQPVAQSISPLAAQPVVNTPAPVPVPAPVSTPAQVTNAGNMNAAPPPVPPRSPLTGLAKKKPGTLLYTFNGHQKAVYGLAWMSDNQHIASRGGDGLQYWDVRKGLTVFSSPRYVLALDHSPDGTRLVTCAYNRWDIWALPSGREVFSSDGLGSIKFGYKQNSICTLAWSPDGEYIAFGMEDGQVVIWNVAARCIHVQSQLHGRHVTSLSWSPDSRYLASGSRDQRMCVSMITTSISVSQGTREVLKTVYSYSGYDNAIQKVAWSPDGRYIGIGGFGRAVHIYDVPDGKNVVRYQEPRSVVDALAWPFDSQYLAVGSRDHQVYLYEIATARTVLIYSGHNDDVNTLCWSPDGRMLASGSNDRTVQVWRAPF